jgi:hypothetical protein
MAEFLKGLENRFVRLFDDDDEDEIDPLEDQSRLKGNEWGEIALLGENDYSPCQEERTDKIRSQQREMISR